jgi:hypothetical protein
MRFPIGDHPLMSHQQIIDCFKCAFGREMTAAERRAFFLCSSEEELKQPSKKP